MKVDRELLELAAKAAGYDVRWHEAWQCFVHVGPHNITNPPTMAGQRMVWAPLYDDGDALRLAVALRLTIYHDELAVIIKHKRYSWEWMGEMVDEDSGDRNSATRRAIVRAAAAIGEQMP